MAARLVLAELVGAGALRVRTHAKARAAPPVLLLRGKRKPEELTQEVRVRCCNAPGFLL